MAVPVPEDHVEPDGGQDAIVQGLGETSEETTLVVELLPPLFVVLALLAGTRGCRRGGRTGAKVPQSLDLA